MAQQIVAQQIVSQALTHQPKTNYGSTDTRVEFKNAEADDEYHERSKFKIKLNEVRSMNDFCEWITTDTWSKLGIIFFFISILVPFIFAFYYFEMHEKATSYTIAGIYGICACLYGMNHFRTLFNLKNEIDNYTILNSRLQTEREAMDEQVNQLRKGRKELKQTHNHLRISNLKMVDMIRKFESLEDQLDALNVSNNEQLTEIGHHADKLRGKYYQIALQQQRNILWKLFDRLESKGVNKRGITEEDYKVFHDLLPQEYRDRFDRLGGFKGLLKASNSKKKYIDAKKFERVLSVYAKMHVENVDFVFKLTPIKAKKKGEDTAPGVLRGVTIISKKIQAGFYLSKQAIWAASKQQLEEEGKSSRSATPEHVTTPDLGKQKRINY